MNGRRCEGHLCFREDGYVYDQEAADGKSGLPQPLLAAIWNMVDTPVDNRGQLEFAMGVRFDCISREQLPMPGSLRRRLVHPKSRQSAIKESLPCSHSRHRIRLRACLRNEKPMQRGRGGRQLHQCSSFGGAMMGSSTFSDMSIPTMQQLAAAAAATPSIQAQSQHDGVAVGYGWCWPSSPLQPLGGGYFGYLCRSQHNG
jgi:hypothetical protein